MDQQWDNTNTARLFPVEEKKKDSWPDEKGGMDIDGSEFWLSSWHRTAKSGVEYRSIAATPKTDDPSARRNFSGVLFRVREPSSEKAPTLEGNLELENGKKVSLVGWERISKVGNPWVSIKVEPYQEKSKPQQEPQQQQQPVQQASLAEEFDDDIPW